MRYSLTQEEVDRVIAYVNGEGDKDFSQSDIPVRLSRIHADMVRRMDAEVKAQRKRIATLETRLEQQARRRKAEDDEAAFAEDGWDAVALARVLAYHLRRLGLAVTASRLNLLLFYLYAMFLEKFGERLTVDSPKAQEWGPQFWTLHGALCKGRLSLADAGTWEDMREVAEKDARLVKVAGNVTAYLSRYDDDTLADLYRRSDAWQDAVRRGGGKWGVTMDDARIRRWKRGLQMP